MTATPCCWSITTSRGVAALVDRVLAMYLGQRIAEGTAEQVMRDETVRRVYLGGHIQAAARDPARQASRATLLEVEGLSVSYGKAQALDNVSLRVGTGEFVSIVGLNGAGKTTLFNAICGLVPATGSIRFAGADLRGRTAARIARAGLVQCPESRELFASMSVRENLDLGGQHHVARVLRAAARLAAGAVPHPARPGSARLPAPSRAASSRCWRSPAR